MPIKNAHFVLWFLDLEIPSNIATGAPINFSAHSPVSLTLSIEPELIKLIKPNNRRYGKKGSSIQY